MKAKLALTNGRIFDQYKQYEDQTLLIADGKIVGICSEINIPSDYECINVESACICPGLIDLQIYGTGDLLFSAELTEEALLAIDANLLKQGCTGYMLTLATNTLTVFKEAIAVFRRAKPKAALGLHLEGPFLNPKKRGAHPEELIIQATLAILQDLIEGNEDVVKMMTIAPELLGEEELAYLVRKGILLSAGHSAATSAEASLGFDQGIATTTHLWNAMSPLLHREIGLPGAVFRHQTANASIIADGIHVNFDAVRLSKQLLGERLFLITDAVGRCQKGIYQHVLNVDHYVLPDGTLSGSALTQLKSVENCVKYVGIPLDESIRMATLYPARLLNRQDIGQFEEGSDANVLVFNQDFQVQQVVFQGELLN